MAKQELLATIRDRYRASSKREKSRILDEFIAVTGHHRKHGIRLLGQSSDDGEQPPAVKKGVSLHWRCETRFTPRGAPQIAGAVVEPDAAAGLKSPGYYVLLAETGSGLVLRPGGRGFAGDP